MQPVNLTAQTALPASELASRRKFQLALLEILRNPPPNGPPLTLDAVLDWAFPQKFKATVAKAQRPQVEEWVDELSQKGMVVKTVAGLVPGVLHLQDPQADPRALVDSLGPSPDLRRWEKVVIGAGLMLSVIFFAGLHLFFFPNNLFAQAISAATLGSTLLGGLFLPAIRVAVVPSYLKPSWMIPAAIALPLMLGGALLFGYLNPVRIHVRPGAEILVDQKHFRTISPDANPRVTTYSARLTWEPHEITVRKPYFLDPTDHSSGATRRVEWEPWGREAKTDLSAYVHLDPKPDVPDKAADSQQKQLSAVANTELRRLMARLVKLPAIKDRLALSAEAASLRIQVAALANSSLGTMALSVRALPAEHLTQEVSTRDVFASGIPGGGSDSLFQDAAEDIYHKLGLKSDVADGDCQLVLVQEKGAAKNPQSTKTDPERDPNPAAIGLTTVKPVARSLAESLVRIARQELGVRESPPGSNRGPRIDEYLRASGLPESDVLAGQPWGTAFTYWVVREAYNQDKASTPIPPTAYGPDLYAWAEKNAKTVPAGKPAAPGDLCFLANGRYRRQAGIVIAFIG